MTLTYLTLFFLLAAVHFNLEAHDLFDAHRLEDSERQVLAVVEVRTDRASNAFVVLAKWEIEVLALLEVLVEQSELPLVRDVDELELSLADDGARHRVRGGADELVLLEGEEILARDGALGAAVLAVLERFDLDDLRGAPADADEVALLEIASLARNSVGGTSVSALEDFFFDVEESRAVVVAVGLATFLLFGVIKIFFVERHVVFFRFFFFGVFVNV